MAPPPIDDVPSFLLQGLNPFETWTVQTLTEIRSLARTTNGRVTKHDSQIAEVQAAQAAIKDDVTAFDKGIKIMTNKWVWIGVFVALLAGTSTLVSLHVTPVELIKTVIGG